MASTVSLFVCILLCLSYCALSYEFCSGPDWFKCNNDRCLATFFRCDGDNDCGDNSDEVDCPNANSTVPSTRVPCATEQFTCANGDCIPTEKYCNQVKDCSDGSDEFEGCVHNKTCKDTEYRCANGYCIKQTWVCDGERDCADDSDETNCDTHTAETCTNERSLFFCVNGRCISLNNTCDHKNDCGDNSDEHDSNCMISAEKCKSELHCSHQCRPTPKGPMCTCPPGYKLLNNQTCQDINECLENPQICDQHCVDEPGSYSCLCDIAYDLQADNRTCKVAKDRGDALLVFSSKTEIRAFYLSPNEIYYPIAKNLQHVVGVSLDATYVYWSDIKMGDEAIFRAFEDGSGAEVVVTAGLGMPEEIAVDWLTGNIYFTDSLYKRIGVCTNDGSHCTIIITESTDKPRGLALHPATGEMYWSDWGKSPHISRAEMDGKSQSPLVTEKLVWPNGLTIDYPNSRLYWVDAKMELIESINLDGTDRRTVLKTVATHPFSIAVFEDKLYWSDWTTKSIHYCNKFTGKGEKVLLQEIDEIYGIHIYHSVLKPDLHNPCNAHPCQEMCLLAADHKYTCACSPDKVLAGDGKKCNRIRDGSHQHLIVAAGGIFIDYYHEILGKPTMNGSYTFHHFAGVVYDSINKSLIISDQRSRTVSRFDPESAESSRILSVSNEAIGGMSFDYFGNNLYWSDIKHKTIEIHSLTTMQSTVLHFTEEPTSILVIPELAIMYVAFCSDTKCHLDKMSMNGLSRTQVISFLLGPRISLAYCPIMKRIFIADEGSGIIESISIDGFDPKVLHMGLKQPVSLAVLGDEIFWTLRDSKRIFWSDKQNIVARNKGLTLLVPTEVDIMHLVTLTESDPLQSLHRCRTNNGGCSHVCLVDTHVTSECRCPSGMTLSSDKKTCVIETSSCSSDEYRCSDDHTCIDKTLLCDGIDHCHNGEDEENCKPTVCQPDQFTCRDSGECLPNYKVCDGISQCFDSSDEVNCETRVCNDDQFKCPSGLCIPASWECDGHWDCEDGADEAEKCTRKACPKAMFTCENYKCIDAKLICNAIDDCEDGSDELHCSKDPDYSLGNCGISEYRCFGTDKCISMSSRCDGEQDCPKNDDEHHCSHCVGDEFACANLKCIPRIWMCDNEDDCGDGSDEKGCDENKHFTSLGPLHHDDSLCPEFKCNVTGRCIQWDFVCDGISDCYDSSDEDDKCSIVCTDEHQCQQLCQRTPSGPMCKCRKGYRLNSDGKTCDDIDECEEKVCSQICRNKIGSFDCSCFPGYVLRTDRTSCKVIEGSMEFLTATKDDIRRIPPNLEVIEVVHRQPQIEITGLDVNVRKASLYWSSELLGTIQELNTKSKRIKRLRNVGRPRVLAVDWVTDYVYYFDTEKPPCIKACSTEEKKCAVIMEIDGSGTVMSIAVEPEEGWLFWSQSSFIDSDRPSSEIWRSDFNGGNKTSIARENLGVVSGMSIDYERKTLYWVDTSMQIIEKSNLDGSARETFLKEEVYQPISINVYEDSIYWLMGSSGVLQKCSLGMKKDCEAIQVKNNNVRELFVINHISRQRNLKNKCENHGCDYMCVQRKDSATCICHDGTEQSENGICPNSDLLNVQLDTRSLLLGKTEDLEKQEREGGAVTALLIAAIIGVLFLSSCYYYQKHKNALRSKYDLSIHFQNPTYNNPAGITTDYVLPIAPPGELEYENPLSEHASTKIQRILITPRRTFEINSDHSDVELGDDTSDKVQLIRS